MSAWQYLTVFISGTLEFPEAISEPDALKWAAKAISQELNEYARQGWHVIDIEWISHKEVMVTFERPTGDDDAGQGSSA